MHKSYAYPTCLFPRLLPSASTRNDLLKSLPMQVKFSNLAVFRKNVQWITKHINRSWVQTSDTMHQISRTIHELSILKVLNTLLGLWNHLSLQFLVNKMRPQIQLLSNRLACSQERNIEADQVFLLSLFSTCPCPEVQIAERYCIGEISPLNQSDNSSCLSSNASRHFQLRPFKWDRADILQVVINGLK